MLTFLTFHRANFRLVLNIKSALPTSIDWAVRVNTKSVELADRLPLGYNFTVATERVRSAFALIVKDVEFHAREEGRYLNAEDINRLKDAVANLQPFLCSRTGLGFKGAVLKADSMPEGKWPDLEAHLEQCDGCGYLPYVRSGFACGV